MTTIEPRGSAGPDPRGRVLGGRFQLERLVGRGGSAGVYLALDNHMRRRVALKVIHPEHPEHARIDVTP